MIKHKLKIGDIVRRPGKKRTRRVIYLYKDIPGGVRLDREIEGFVSWNEMDLEFVRHASKEWLLEHDWLVEIHK